MFSLRGQRDVSSRGLHDPAGYVMQCRVRRSDRPRRFGAANGRLLRTSPAPQGPTLLVVRNAQRRRGSPVPCLPGVPLLYNACKGRNFPADVPTMEELRGALQPKPERALARKPHLAGAFSRLSRTKGSFWYRRPSQCRRQFQRCPFIVTVGAICSVI